LAQDLKTFFHVKFNSLEFNKHFFFGIDIVKVPN